MNVRKSDSTIEDFSANKVINGICEAYNSIGEKCPEGLLDSMVKNLYLYENIQTSEIRRQVEECLMSINKKVAKSYISKYEKIDADGRLLVNKDDFITNYINASNASTGSKYDSNANVSNKNIATLNAEIPKQGNIQFNRYNTSNKIAKLFTKKLAKQYIEDIESHILYKNDESSFGINSPYCVAIQSYPFLTDGLKGLGGLSAAPKNLDSFCGMFVNLVFAVSSQFAGACLYKDQKLLLKENNLVYSKKIKDFVNNFELNKQFENYQGEWEYKDISDKGISILEDGKYVKVNKVFRRKYDKKIYHIKSHEQLECFVSEDHRFKTLFRGREIEVKAKDLLVDDTVFINKDLSVKDLKLDTIQSIETFDNDDNYVYEIETETHWYNCGGFITHNCAVAGFFNMFDYYARKEWGDNYYNNDNKAARLKYNENGEENPISISKQIEQYYQAVVYSINQPAAARGFQSA